MKSASTDLATHVTQEVTTCAWLIKVTRLDGYIYGMTDHDYSITFVGQVYYSDVSYSKFNVNDTANLKESTTQIDIPIDGTVFRRDDFLARRWDYASVEILLVNWANLAQGAMIIATGSFGSFAIQENVASADYRGLSYALRQVAGDVCQPECRVDFGSPLTQIGGGCGINLVTKRQTGTVVDTDGAIIISASGLVDNGTDQYQGGLITFATGNNAGLSSEYRQATFNTDDIGAHTFIQLELSTLLPITVGDTFDFVPGCDKTIAQCTAYGNAENFQGEPYAPQPDAAQAYPDYVPPKNA